MNSSNGNFCFSVEEAHKVEVSRNLTGGGIDLRRAETERRKDVLRKSQVLAFGGFEHKNICEQFYSVFSADSC